MGRKEFSAMRNRKRQFLTLALASGLAINLVGVIRTIIATPVEWWIGLSAANIVGFRIVSGIVDTLLSFFFGFAREGIYKLGFANRRNPWHKFALDTTSFAVYKSISYSLCLCLCTKLPVASLKTLILLNVLLFITTGAFNCWYIDVLHKQIPDLTSRLVIWWTKKTKRKEKN